MKKNLFAGIALSCLFIFFGSAQAASIAIPDLVGEGSLVSFSVSFDSLDFQEATFSLDGNKMATLYLFGAGKNVIEHEPQVLMSAFSPGSRQWYLSLVPLSRQPHTLSVKSEKSGTLAEQAERTFAVVRFSTSSFEDKTAATLEVLKTELLGLGQKGSDAQSTLNALTKTLEGLRVQQVSALEELARLQSDKNQLKTALVALEQDLGEEKGKVAVLTRDAEDRERKIATLEKELGTGKGGNPLSGLLTFIGDNALPAILFILLLVGIVGAIMMWNKVRGEEHLYQEISDRDFSRPGGNGVDGTDSAEPRPGKWAHPSAQEGEPEPRQSKLGLGDLVRKERD